MSSPIFCILLVMSGAKKGVPSVLKVRTEKKIGFLELVIEACGLVKLLIKLYHRISL